MGRHSKEEEPVDPLHHTRALDAVVLVLAGLSTSGVILYLFTYFN